MAKHLTYIIKWNTYYNNRRVWRISVLYCSQQRNTPFQHSATQQLIYNTNILICSPWTARHKSPYTPNLNTRSLDVSRWITDGIYYLDHSEVTTQNKKLFKTVIILTYHVIYILTLSLLLTSGLILFFNSSF